MGILDWLTGTRRPPPGVPAEPPEAVRQAILSVNRPTAPFVVRACTPGDPEQADLVCEWRMREPGWYIVFGKAELQRSFQVFMRLDPRRRRVRSIDRSQSVTWSAGIPSIGCQSRWSRGREYEFRLDFQPFYETTPQGERIAWRFSSRDLERPLWEAVAKAGWTWRSISWGRL